jgi:hypothetical protein
LILDDLQNRGGEPGMGFWFFHGASAPVWGGESDPGVRQRAGGTFLRGEASQLRQSLWFFPPRRRRRTPGVRRG